MVMERRQRNQMEKDVGGFIVGLVNDFDDR